MKKKILSAISSAVLSLSVMTTAMPVSASVYYGPSEPEFGEIFTIQLEGAPLAEYEYALENGVNEFILTDEGKKAYDDLIEEHDKAVGAIEDFLGHETVRNFDHTAVIDGISLSELTIEEYYRLEENSAELGIKDIFCDYAPRTGTASFSKAAGKEYTSVDMTETIFENTGIDSTGLKGDSTVIAIIDNEFDTGHEYISTMPENAEGRIDSGYVKEMAPYLAAKTKESEDPYINEKIPFCYNYAYMKTDTSLKESNNENTHGTHVAGIAGGNGAAVTSEEYSPRGTAPDAQLLLMSAGMNDGFMITMGSVLAALNDCAYLGADIINLSNSGALAPVPEGTLFADAVNNLEKLGIMYCSSAGNSGKIDFGPDSLVNTGYSTVGRGGAFNSAFSVASAENPIYIDTVISVGGEKFAFYSDEGYMFEAEFLDKETEFAVIPGNGCPEDFEGIDVNGKIAVMNRDGIYYEEKSLNALENGAVGVIFINDEPDDHYPFDSVLPSVVVRAEDGKKLIECKEKKLTVMSEMFTERIIGDISYFSSFGPNEYLTLKPEITAYGGNIISSVSGDNSYDIMSGTSMSAPQIAGISALLKEYLKDNREKYGISTPAEAYENGGENVFTTLDSGEFLSFPVYIGIRGDADMNGETNLYDAIYIAKYMIWNPDSDVESEFSEFEGSMGKYLADCDKNGSVDLYDAIWIAKSLLK